MGGPVSYRGIGGTPIFCLCKHWSMQALLWLPKICLRFLPLGALQTAWYMMITFVFAHSLKFCVLWAPYEIGANP